jgi:hypothetical protein
MASGATLKTAAAALMLLVLLAGPLAALDVGGKINSGGSLTAVDSTVEADTADPTAAAAQLLGCTDVQQCTDCQGGCSECERLPAVCESFCSGKCPSQALFSPSS